MRLWLIPMTYVAASAVCGIVWPRIWRHFLSSYVVDVSVASAQAVLAAVASGMMALTGLVFALAFVMVQFSATAYSPRLVNWLARDPLLYHAMGAFSATFIYAHSSPLLPSIAAVRAPCLCFRWCWSEP